MTTTVLTKKVRQISIGPACPARLAAARLRRAFVLPILAAPPVRATQTSFLLESKNKRTEIVLNEEGKLVYKKRNYWLVLTRTSLAGFDAPIDITKMGALHHHHVQAIKGPFTFSERDFSTQAPHNVVAN